MRVNIEAEAANVGRLPEDSKWGALQLAAMIAKQELVDSLERDLWCGKW